MKPANEDMERALTELLDRTVEDFGPTALWNIPSGLPPRVRANAVYAGIAKHGGQAGFLYVDPAGHPCLPDPVCVTSGRLILREARPGGG